MKDDLDSQPPFVLSHDGNVRVNLPKEVRDMLSDLANELKQSLGSDDANLKRLFPTAYPDDPEKDAGYQVFSRDQLIEGRNQSINFLQKSAHSKQITVDELSVWMRAINDIRLVLGTKLDIAEDAYMPQFDLDASQEDAEIILSEFILYEGLGELLDNIVTILTDGLPPTAN